MEQLFTQLADALEGSYAVGLMAAFTWGVLSILLSPCHLASIPLIVGYVGTQSDGGKSRAFLTASFFAFGILLSIAAIGLLTAGLGGLVGDIGPWGNYVVAGVFFVFGLVLLDVLSLPWSGPDKVKFKQKGLLGAVLLGLIFGAAVGPCTFAYMAPMLAVVFKYGATSPIYGVTMLLIYGAGHCGVIVLAGGSGEIVGKYLGWNEKSRGAVVLRKVCGSLMLLCGLYLLFIAR